LEPSGATWTPGFLFVLLGCFFLQKAVRPAAKQSWSWGRGGGPVPVSRWGYASWAASCFAVALIIAQAPEPPMASVLAFLACFLALLGMGFIDSRRYHKTRRVPDPQRDERV